MSASHIFPGDGNAPATTGRPFPRRACVVDLDNLLQRGLDKSTGHARARAGLNVLAFASELRSMGIVDAVICRNWQFHLIEQRLWNALGFETVATHTNCDQEVMRTVAALVAAGSPELILVAGDGDYLNLVRTVRACGVSVEIWARSASTAAALITAADKIRYIDDLLHIPAQNQPFALAA